MFGIFSWYGINIKFKERISSIKEAGFEATSIWLGTEEDLVKENKINDMPIIVRDSGLYLENVHIPFNNCNDIWSNDTSLIEPLYQEYKKYLSFCYKNEIPIMVMHISKGNQIKEINKNGIDFLIQLVKIAEDLNIKIALENTRIPVFINKVYQQINSKHLGFCYDSSHDILYSNKPYVILKENKEKLFCIHISDNDGKNDSHWLPYEGIINWKLLIESFPKEYTGVYTLEVVPKDNENNIDFLKIALKRIKRIENEIDIRPKNCS
jgi:sugar phosphate isomerase/epimerase